MSLYEKLLLVKQALTETHIKRTQRNPHFRYNYADINDISATVEPLLQEQKLLLLQPIIDRRVCSVIIDIESGDKVESWFDLSSTENDPQAVGSCITYYRRYTLQSLLNLVTEDDDGNEGARSVKTAHTKIHTWLTDEQFEKTLKSEAEMIENVLKAYNGTQGKGMQKKYETALRIQLKNLLDKKQEEPELLNNENK